MVDPSVTLSSEITLRGLLTLLLNLCPCVQSNRDAHN